MANQLSLSPAPKDSVFQSLQPRCPKISPASNALQEPRHPCLESSSPLALRHSDRAVGDARKLSTQGKNPLHASPHSLTPSAIPRHRGVCPRIASRPPGADFESGNKSSGKLPPARVRPHQSAAGMHRPIVLTLCSPGLQRLPSCWTRVKVLFNALHLCLASVCTGEVAGHWRLSVWLRDSNQGDLAPGKHLAMAGDVLYCFAWETVLPAFCEKRQGGC